MSADAWVAEDYVGGCNRRESDSVYPSWVDRAALLALWLSTQYRHRAPFISRQNGGRRCRGCHKGGWYTRDWAARRWRAAVVSGILASIF